MSDRPPSPTATQLADDLHDVVGLFRRRSRRTSGDPLPELSLSGAQLELVRVVRRNPGLGVAEAAAALGLAANTVSTLVGQLTAMGLVERQRDTLDRRVARLQLTPSATAALASWRDRRAQVTAEALARLDADEQAAVARALPLLARVAAALPEPQAQPPAHPQAQPASPSTPA